MPLKSTSEKYGTVAVSIHWVSAILIFVLLGSGFRAGATMDAAAKIGILQVHIPLGVTILVLTLARIAWWFFADHKPASVSMPAWQDRSSRAVHFLFYVIILGMAASGIGMLILSGAGTLIFSASSTVLPDFQDFLPRTPHGIGARAMIALLVLHAGAALYHHIFKKDQLLRRMWYGAE